MNDYYADPYILHVEYEQLHPFTDGNGRSGRAMWLYAMKKCGRLEQGLNLGFLHAFYYQTLSAQQGVRSKSGLSTG
jgi:hypothetical protein